ncbi:hypothetical protein EVAR_49180_1 [Eumeta japonica]|uniref:Uncharacterized protein n=1 Tax=Eumeta variegata TaxID=151549 RepID=A0A4C1YIZ4_EUMVA|nr:hypothetical protein EVAR_49180_1 [Eumeta japonica]
MEKFQKINNKQDSNPVNLYSEPLNTVLDKRAASDSEATLSSNRPISPMLGKRACRVGTFTRSFYDLDMRRSSRQHYRSRLATRVPQTAQSNHSRPNIRTHINTPTTMIAGDNLGRGTREDAMSRRAVGGRRVGLRRRFGAPVRFKRDEFSFAPSRRLSLSGPSSGVSSDKRLQFRRS